MERMAEIVFTECRPFSHLDFIPKFMVNDRVYSIKYGTLRNKISKFRKKGEIELGYRTNQAFYTLVGQHFRKHKRMTFNHMGGPLSSPVIR